MYKLIDFGNVFSIAFAVNLIFVLFEISPRMDDFFHRKIINLGIKELSQYLPRHEIRYITNDSKLKLALLYSNLKGVLISLSAFNSLLSIIILIYSGFFPDLISSTFQIIFLIILFFVPIVLIPSIIFIYFPYIRLKRYKIRIDKLISDKDDISDAEKTELINKYYSILYILSLNNSITFMSMYFKNFDMQYVCDLMNNNSDKE